MRRMMSALLIAGLLMVSPPARAQGTGFIWSWSILNLAGGSVSGVGSAVAAGTSDNPSLGWIIPGFVFGGLNTMTGLVYVGVGVDLSDSDSEKDLLLGLGIAHLVVSVLDFVAASVAVAKRRPKKRYYPPPYPYPYQQPQPPPSQPPPAPQPTPSPQISLSPIILGDTQSKLGWGLGLQVFGW